MTPNTAFTSHAFGTVALAACWLAASLASAGEKAPVRVADFDDTWRGGRWRFSNGAEFPGATGRFERSPAAAKHGRWGGRLVFDFTKGGAYVAAQLALDDAPSIAAVRVCIRKPRGHQVTFRYTDRTGQTLQKRVWVPHGRWADVTIAMSGWTGHWGGRNDGVVHGPPKRIAFLVGNTAGPTGELWLDDVRLVPGRPGKTAGMVATEYVAARFGADEGWRARAHGRGGRTQLRGRELAYDFTQGASCVAIVPDQYTLLGVPQSIRLRARGAAQGHPVRLRLATHFMMFEKTLGPLRDAGGGVAEAVTDAPPGPGWRWFWGENDGKLHGPLRMRGVYLDAAGRADHGTLELLDIRVKTACPPHRCLVFAAERRRTAAGEAFVATVRSLAEKPLRATVSHAIRDWGGKVLARGEAARTVPPGAEPVAVTVPVPPGRHTFLEAEFAVEAPGQITPAAQAYTTKPVAPHGSDRAAPGSPFGMGLYLYRYPNTPAGLKEMARAAALARDIGVKWSREGFGWGRVERRKGQFDWSFHDTLVATAKRNGISIYGLMSGWAPWTRPYTKQGIADYCRYAAAAAARYKDDITYWEVWNEPNIFFWQGPKDLYAELLRRAYAAIKKANPHALVLGCSTAGIDAKFIRRMLELRAPFDVLTIHPYRRHLNDRAFMRDLAAAGDLVRRPDGSRRAVWITEMGWATHAHHNGSQRGFNATTERQQACLLARAYLGAIASGAAANISWYDFRNDGRDPFYFEHNLGIVTRDFEPKPACRAFATLTRLLEGRPHARHVDLGRDVWAHTFSDVAGRGAVLALWAMDRPREISLPARQAHTLVDLMGTRTKLASAGGKVTLTAPLGSPVFVLPAPGTP